MIAKKLNYIKNENNSIEKFEIRNKWRKSTILNYRESYLLEL
jgi:hypothetical protein